MLNLKLATSSAEERMPVIGQCWKENLFLDGEIQCSNGRVSYSRCVLSLYSAFLQKTMTADTDIILLKDMSIEAVSPVVAALHGVDMFIEERLRREVDMAMECLGVNTQEGPKDQTNDRPENKTILTAHQTAGKSETSHDAKEYTVRYLAKNAISRAGAKNATSRTGAKNATSRTGAKSAKGEKNSRLKSGSESASLDATISAFEDELKELGGSPEAEAASDILVRCDYDLSKVEVRRNNSKKEKVSLKRKRSVEPTKGPAPKEKRRNVGAKPKKDIDNKTIDTFIRRATRPVRYICRFEIKSKNRKSFCGFENPDHTCVRSHVLSHLGIFMCAVCQAQFESEADMQAHKESHAEVDKRDQADDTTVVSNESSSLVTEEQTIADNTSTAGTGEGEAEQEGDDLPDPGGGNDDHSLQSQHCSDQLMQDNLYQEQHLDAGSQEVGQTEAQEEEAIGPANEGVPVLKSYKYHKSTKAIYMPEEKARSIISSYMAITPVSSNDKDEATEIRIGCSLCNFENAYEAEVYEHVALVHLKIFQYKCPYCSLKLKLRRQLSEHLAEAHSDQTDEVSTDTVKLETISSEIIIKCEDNIVGQEMILDASSAEPVDELKAIQNFLNQPAEDKPVQPTAVPDDDCVEQILQDTAALLEQAPAEAVTRTSELSGGGTCRYSVKRDKLYFGDASEPLLSTSKQTLRKLLTGSVMSKEEAEQLISGKFVYNAEGKQYECLICCGKVKKPAFGVIQRHLLDHFNIYWYRCALCNDMFRNQTHYKEHLEAHQKQKSRDDQLLARQHAKHSQNCIGDYHLKEDFTYIPRQEAEEIVNSYFTVADADNGGLVYMCKLCTYTSPKDYVVYNHCVKVHLKIYQYSCPDCQAKFKVLDDMRRHCVKVHQKRYVSSPNSRCSVSKEYYEDEETEVPDGGDITAVPLESLKGKKISTKQWRQLRGKNIIYNEDAGLFECELCDFKKEWRTTLQAHVMSKHYDIYCYRCPVENCRQLIRNWTQFSIHQRVHSREKKRRESVPSSSADISGEHHLLTEPTFFGEQEGLKIARNYVFMDSIEKTNKCKFCEYKGKLQLVTMHVLANHLKNVFLYRCNFCGKEFRYSKLRFKEHLLLHTEGKVRCEYCASSDKAFTRESLKAHVKRNHSVGTFMCSVEDCKHVAITKAHLKQHTQEVHLIGIPSKHVSHICQICDYAFPTRTRLKKHTPLCQRGTSRTGFRKQISDCLQWLGQGGYRCNFCLAEFHPAPGDDVTATGLPEARNHVAAVHGMKHMRKAKMSWHGMPKSLDKSEMFRDKSDFFQAKLKDLEKSRAAVMRRRDQPEMEPQHLLGEQLLLGGDHEDVFVDISSLEGGGQVIEEAVVQHKVLVNVVGEDGAVEQREVLVDPAQFAAAAGDGAAVIQAEHHVSTDQVMEEIVEAGCVQQEDIGTINMVAGDPNMQVVEQVEAMEFVEV